MELLIWWLFFSVGFLGGFCIGRYGVTDEPTIDNVYYLEQYRGRK